MAACDRGRSRLRTRDDDRMGDRLAWYVAYGSNRDRDRLMAYLAGATAEGPFGAHRGCTDPTPPRDDRWITLDRAVAFRGRSRRWGGGVAFLALDPAPGVATRARAWLLGLDQIAGLAAQEGRLGEDPDPAALAAIPPGGTLVIGGGWYDTVLRLPDLVGRPALTVTTSQPLPERAPTAAYRDLVTRAGLVVGGGEGGAGAGRVDDAEEGAAGGAPGLGVGPEPGRGRGAGEGEPDQGDVGAGGQQGPSLG